MFKDLLRKSPDCNNPTTLLLSDVMEAISSSKSSKSQTIPPSGFVFHESRCGSTLVANNLAGVNPDQHRVYSESAPLITAMKMIAHDIEVGDTENVPNEALQFLQSVVTLMGRTPNPHETKLFFKIQSIGTTYAHGLRLAFPDVPWIFVYRDPVQVMMSHMPEYTENAVCLRSRRNASNGLKDFVQEMSKRSFRSLSTYEMCAAHLSYLCQCMIDEHRTSNTGRMVNYDDLPNILLEDIFPHYFQIPITDVERERVKQVSSKYSKGRVVKSRIWMEDSKQKDERASMELKTAAEAFLYGNYRLLQGSADNEAI